MKRLFVLARLRGDAISLVGRDAWALGELMQAGSQGVTPIDNPAPRWSGYIHNLRKLGFDIETIREPHRGRFPGSHARYVLHDEVRIEHGPSFVGVA